MTDQTPRRFDSTFEELLAEWIPDHGPSDEVRRLRDEGRARIVDRPEHVCPTATHVALYVNQTLDSSSLGMTKVIFVGPDQTFKFGEEPPWLGDMPSQRMHLSRVAPIPQKETAA